MNFRHEKDAVAANIKAFIAENRSQIIHELCELCRIPSVKEQMSGVYPYGKNVNDVLCAAKELAEKNGLKCEISGSGKYALAELRGSGHSEKTIGVFSHCDVVPANAEEWIKTAPFEPVIENGYIFCRGCDDNKASAVAAVYIAKMIKSGILPVKSSYICYFGGNEEAGMDDIKDYVSNEKLPDVCLVPDNGYPVCVGEKGIARFTVKAKKPFEQILSFNGGIAVNAVIGTLIVKLRAEKELYEELCKNAEDIGAESFDISLNDYIITVEAKGKSAHAAHPDGTVNAAVLAAKLLCKCMALCENDRKMLESIVALTEDYHGGALGIDFSDEKFGRTSFVLGKSRYECGETLTMQFDIRFGTKISAQEITSRVSSVFSENGFSASADRITECFVTELDKKYIDAALKVYKDCTGESEAEPYYSAGGTYARELKKAVSIGAQDFSHIEKRISGLSEDRGGAHQPDECLCIDAYLDGILTNSLILLEIDGVLNDSGATEKLYAVKS